VSRTPIDLAPKIERAVLVGAPRKRSASDRLHVDDHLQELADLADTAGVEVVGQLIQQIDRPNAATYLGSGKVDELKLRIQETKASLVIFDDELSPAQGKNLEEETGTRVMDRAELILDIFAVRARSAEAKMQVELAQLEYMLPRLARMWSHLERQGTGGGGGKGPGMRGPGETQIETDRRLIGHRLKVLKARLAEVAQQRQTQRAGRTGAFRVSLVGYTNAGKSTILRALSGDRTVFVEDRLFATLDPLTREVALDDVHTCLLTDTVGFVRKLPHQLVASFRATLEEARSADVLIHVMDVSDSMWEEHRDVVEAVLAEIEASEVPVLPVFNKADLLPAEERAGLGDRLPEVAEGALVVSATEPDGLAALKAALVRLMLAQKPEATVRIPGANGKLSADVHRLTEVLSEKWDEHGPVFRVRSDTATLGRLARMGAEVTR
jgi:GTP-binding protein HflX